MSGWVSTTRRWLQSNGHYSGRGGDGIERLRSALVKLRFGEVDSQLKGESPSQYRDGVTAVLEVWGEIHHAALKAYLEKGGYDEDKKRLPAMSTAAKLKRHVGPAEPTKVAPRAARTVPANNLHTLEMPDGREIDQEGRPAPRDEEAELAAALDEIERMDNPNVGAW